MSTEEDSTTVELLKETDKPSEQIDIKRIKEILGYSDNTTPTAADRKRNEQLYERIIKAIKSRQ